ncbi:Autophagy-related protein 11 [Linum perenne]
MDRNCKSGFDTLEWYETSKFNHCDQWQLSSARNLLYDINKIPSFVAVKVPIYKPVEWNSMTLIANKDEKKSEYFRVIETQICGGLDQYYCYKVIGQNYIECIKQHHQIHSELMVNFTRDLEKLRSMKLHLALQTNNWKCLMDFMSGGEVEEGCGDCCGNSQKKFEKKMLEFKQMRKVEEKLFAWRASAPIKNSSSIIEQKSVMQSLRLVAFFYPDNLLVYRKN